MAKFRFTRETTKRVIVVDTYDIEADSYEDAVRMLEDADMEIENVGEYIATDTINKDEYSCNDEFMIVNSDGEEIS